MIASYIVQSISIIRKVTHFRGCVGWLAGNNNLGIRVVISKWVIRIEMNWVIHSFCCCGWLWDFDGPIYSTLLPALFYGCCEFCRFRSPIRWFSHQWLIDYINLDRREGIPRKKKEKDVSRVQLIFLVIIPVFLRTTRRILVNKRLRDKKSIINRRILKVDSN